MIRFIPDTWQEALLRPVAMAMPDAGIYVEIIAPDFRFMFVLLLATVWAMLRIRRPQAARSVWALLLFCAFAFIPWLATSGNGRYFFPVLLVAGPLCVGLVYHLPLSRSLRLALVLIMLGLQALLIYDNSPWKWWGLVPWKDGRAFAVDVPADVRSKPATYITVTPISYSLIAPAFHSDSRWINLTTQQGVDDSSPDAQRTRRFLASGTSLTLVFPSLPGVSLSEGVPHEQQLVLNLALAPHAVQLGKIAACRSLPSPGLTDMGLRENGQPAPGGADRGFWLCPLQKMEEAQVKAVSQGASPQVERVFEKLERMCPRLFRPGEASTTVLPDLTARRIYPGSDMKVYVLKEGDVMYKYLRALNPVILGRADEVMRDDFRIDCLKVPGRGLPWHRES